MAETIDVAVIMRPAVIREGLSQILSQNAFRVVHSVDCAQDLEPGAAGRDPQPRLILVANADRSVVSDQLPALAALFPQARIALLIGEFNLQALIDALRAGAHGFILADSSRECLVQSLRLIAMGERLLPSQLADNLPLHGARAADNGSFAGTAGEWLSPRELDIMRCLVLGSPNKVIARRLNISDSAVKVHLKALLRKLPARNRTQAAMWAAQHGLGAPMPGAPSAFPQLGATHA